MRHSTGAVFVGLLGIALATAVLPEPAIADGSGPVVSAGQTGVGPFAVFTFDPAALQVAPGTTVTWVNPTALYHTVTVTRSTTGDSFSVDLGGLGDCLDTNGDTVPCSFSHTFAQAGAIAYHCIPHAHLGMRGTVVVG